MNLNNDYIPIKEEDPYKTYVFLQKISSWNNHTELYKIKHKKTSEIFAAKIITQNIELYLDKLKFLKKFESPYIVKIYMIYKINNKLYIISEFCDCGSVLDIMKITNKCYKEVEIASIIVMVLKALQYLHLQKICHKNMKLSNILLNNDGVIKLSDININFNKIDNNSKIKKVPPELLKENNKDNYSIKTDIWYLGLICIELAEGDFNNGDKNNNNNGNLWSLEFIDFIQKCLNEDEVKRPSAANLLNHNFILNNNKGKIIIKKKINSIRPLIDIYIEKIDEQEEKNNINDIAEDNFEITSFNENLNKSITEEFNTKINSISVNINKEKYKNKALLNNNNREYQMNKYKKIKKFKIGSKSIQIQNTNRKKIINSINKTTINNNNNNNNIINNKKTSSKKKDKKNSSFKKPLNSIEIFSIDANSIRKKRHSMVLKYIKNSSKLHKYNNEIPYSTKTNKINNTLESVYPRNNLMKLLNTFDRDKKRKKKNLNKSQQHIQKIENIFNIFNKKSKNNKTISSIKYVKYSNYNNSIGTEDKKNNINNKDENIKLKTRNKKSNGGNPTLPDISENNKNIKKLEPKKNKIVRNLLINNRQKGIINTEINNGGKIYNNNEYIFKLNNSSYSYNNYLKIREKNGANSIKNKEFSKKRIKVDKINNLNNNNDTSENSYINNTLIKDNEKSDYIFNINNTDINININNINNYSNNYTNTKKYNDQSYFYSNNINQSFSLSEEDIKTLCLNNKLNERELPELITELAGLENKMNLEIKKIKERYEPVIQQHKKGIKFLKKNPFLKNIKEFKNFENFKNEMKYNDIADDFDSKTTSRSVHNLNKVKISFYKANDIEELNISASKYIFDKTAGYYSNMMKL